MAQPQPVLKEVGLQQPSLQPGGLARLSSGLNGILPAPAPAGSASQQRSQFVLFLLVTRTGEQPHAGHGPPAGVRYTRDGVRGVLQLMGCKPRHAHKAVKHVFQAVAEHLPELSRPPHRRSSPHLATWTAWPHSGSTSEVATGNGGAYSMGKQGQLAEQSITDSLPPQQVFVSMPRPAFYELLCSCLAEFKYKFTPASEELKVACGLRERRRSVTILLCGTSGSGKSTLASLLAGRLGISTVLSTDSVRHLLRGYCTREQHPALFVSTYEAASVILDQQMQEASQQGSDPAESASAGATGGGKGGVGASASMSEVDALIQGYKAQCEPIISLLDSMIMMHEARQESLIIEGVHLHISYVVKLMGRHPSLVPFLLYIKSPTKHTERMAVRAKYMTLDPDKNKYVAHMQSIRWIQDYLVRKAEKHAIPAVENSNVDRTVAATTLTMTSVLKRLARGDTLCDPATRTTKGLLADYAAAVEALNATSKDVVEQARIAKLASAGGAAPLPHPSALPRMTSATPQPLVELPPLTKEEQPHGGKCCSAPAALLEAVPSSSTICLTTEAAVEALPGQAAESGPHGHVGSFAGHPDTVVGASKSGPFEQHLDPQPTTTLHPAAVNPAPPASVVVGAGQDAQQEGTSQVQQGAVPHDLELAGEPSFSDQATAAGGDVGWLEQASQQPLATDDQNLPQQKQQPAGSTAGTPGQGSSSAAAPRGSAGILSSSPHVPAATGRAAGGVSSVSTQQQHVSELPTAADQPLERHSTDKAQPGAHPGTASVPSHPLVGAAATSGSPSKDPPVLLCPQQTPSRLPQTDSRSAPVLGGGAPAHVSGASPSHQAPLQKHLRPVAAKAARSPHPSPVPAPESPFARQQQQQAASLLQQLPLPSPRSASATYTTAPFLAASSSSEDEQEGCSHRRDAQTAGPRSGDMAGRVRQSGRQGGSSQHGAVGLGPASAGDVAATGAAAAAAERGHRKLNSRAGSGSDESGSGGDSSRLPRGNIAPAGGSSSGPNSRQQGGGGKGSLAAPLLGLSTAFSGSPSKGGGGGVGGHSSAAESEVEAALLGYGSLYESTAAYDDEVDEEEEDETASPPPGGGPPADRRQPQSSDLRVYQASSRGQGGRDDGGGAPGGRHAELAALMRRARMLMRGRHTQQQQQHKAGAGQEPSTARQPARPHQEQQHQL